MKRNDVEIRPLQEQDLDEVCAIESASFSMPWTKEAFQGLIDDPLSEYLVVIQDGKVVGCAGYSDQVGVGYINNVVIAKECRNQGLGRKLTETVIEHGEEKGLKEFTLEVRVSNEYAVRLYESLGFESAGVRKRFYEHPIEDAYVMWRRK